VQSAPRSSCFILRHPNGSAEAPAAADEDDEDEDEEDEAAEERGSEATLTQALLALTLAPWP